VAATNLAKEAEPLMLTVDSIKILVYYIKIIRRTTWLRNRFQKSAINLLK